MATREVSRAYRWQHKISEPPEASGATEKQNNDSNDATRMSTYLVYHVHVMPPIFRGLRYIVPRTLPGPLKPWCLAIRTYYEYYLPFFSRGASGEKKKRLCGVLDLYPGKAARKSLPRQSNVPCELHLIMVSKINLPGILFPDHVVNSVNKKVRQSRKQRQQQRPQQSTSLPKASRSRTSNHDRRQKIVKLRKISGTGGPSMQHQQRQQQHALHPRQLFPPTRSALYICVILQ